MSISKARFLFPLFLLLTVCSCANFRTGPAYREKSDSEVANNISLEARAHISAGAHAKALEAYAEAFHLYPGNRALRNGYVSVCQYLIDLADSAFQKTQFAAAGRIYNSLYRSSIAKDIGAALTFDSDYLLARIRRCSFALNEMGIEKYREGKLDDALAIWKTIILFDPDNEEVKRAISTASIQIKNLKRIE